jgi:transcriptional regulator with XRE-family HTH domain
MRTRMEARQVKYPVFLDNLQAILAERKWDQSELAHNVGSTQSSVSRWGWASVPRGETLTRLADLAHVSPTELLDLPIAQARKPRPVGLPSGRKLVETMEALLDTAGLPHLVDEYAAKLARLLPEILADSSAPTGDQPSASKRQPASPPPRRAKGDHDKRQ